MSEEVNYKDNWSDEKTQCKNCTQFQKENGKTACVPPEMTFAEALEKYGEVPPCGHCDFFQAK